MTTAPVGDSSRSGDILVDHGDDCSENAFQWSQTSTSHEQSSRELGWTSPLAVDHAILGSSAQVLLSQEVLTDRETKVLLRTLYSAALVAFTALVSLFVTKLRVPSRSVHDTQKLHLVHIAFASLHFAAASALLVIFLRRLWQVKCGGLKWSKRRHRWVAIYITQLAFIILMSLSYLAPNAYLIGYDCRHISPFVWWSHGVRFTCWSSLLALFVVSVRNYTPYHQAQIRSCRRSDAILLDEGWTVHWVVGLYWVIFELVDVAAMIYGHETRSTVECEDYENGDCDPGHVWLAVTLLFALLCGGYVAMYLYSARKAFVALGNRSYMDFRWTNVGLRYQFRVGLLVMIFGAVDVLLWIVRVDACASFMTARFGFLPAQFSITAFTVVEGFFLLPIKPGLQLPKDSDIGQENYKWAEDEGQPCGQGCDELQPLFCFETAVKLHHWCELIYEYDAHLGKLKRPFDLNLALKLYNLDSIKFMHSKKADTQAVVAWNRQLILVCFRGTYSIANLLADLQLWRVHHPPERCTNRLRGRPKVHKGFLDSWILSDFNKEVIAVLADIVASPGFDIQNMHLLVSGHSLGGAVAQLAAFEIRRSLGLDAGQLSCYTFGCPRVGNHAFAWEYDRVIPDTWHIVNDLDVIARTPKMWILYKRAGKRVVVNSKGDMIVDPMYIEFKFTSLFVAKVSVFHHLLSGYRRSLAAVVSAQFVQGKGFAGHMPVVRKLLQRGEVSKLLGLTENGTCDWSSFAWPTNRKLSCRRGPPGESVEALGKHVSQVTVGDCWVLCKMMVVLSGRWRFNGGRQDVQGGMSIDGHNLEDDVEKGQQGDLILLPGMGICVYGG